MPIVIVLIVNIVTITLSFASLRQSIAVSDTRSSEKFKALENKIDIKFEVVEKQIGEIKDNHLAHLDDKLDKLSDCFQSHLVNHN